METNRKKDRESIKAYVTLNVLFLVYSVCSVCAKLASAQAFLSFRFILFYGFDILFLGIYAIVWQKVLKHVSLTVAYSMKAATVIWGIVWGVLLFREAIGFHHLAGAMLIIAGIIVIGSGSKHE